MNRLLVVLLVALFTGVGCVTQVSNPLEGVAPPLPSTSVETTVPAQELTSGSTDQKECAKDGIPSKGEVLTLLARVSSYAPQQDLVGPALEVQRQWLELERTGWPGEQGTWANDVWLDLRIEAFGEEVLVTLQHGWQSSKTREHTRFRLVCVDGRWLVRQQGLGLDGVWVTPARELPGQRGAMSTDVASDLLQVAKESRGPWFALVATGHALARGQEYELALARGYKPPVLPWKRTTQVSEVRALDENRAVATLGSQQVEFRRVDGLWKIYNFTEGGQWVGSPGSLILAKPGMAVYAPPFGIQVGKTDATAIEQRWGTPDAIAQTTVGLRYTYAHRGVEFQFSPSGKVMAVSMRTGALLSGVRVGAPLEAWELVHGPGSTVIELPSERLTLRVEDGRIVEVKVESSHQ